MENLMNIYWTYHKIWGKTLEVLNNVKLVFMGKSMNTHQTFMDLQFVDDLAWELHCWIDQEIFLASPWRVSLGKIGAPVGEASVGDVGESN